MERRIAGPVVVSYRNSTSNHNSRYTKQFGCLLYLIEILHQTTTSLEVMLTQERLYLIEILHQTTTMQKQGEINYALYLIEILHQTTTLEGVEHFGAALYLIEILHQTTTCRLFVSSL